jgi:hypothetical protein
LSSARHTAGAPLSSVRRRARPQAAVDIYNYLIINDFFYAAAQAS